MLRGPRVNSLRPAILLLALLAVLLATDHLAWTAEPVDASRRDVLILASYHPGLRWDDGIKRAVTEALQPVDNRLELHFEYMDTKRIADPTYIGMLRALYAHKYRNTSFAVILASDNFALNFLLQYRRQLFGLVPVVFCGVNFFRDEMLKDQPLVTGAVEEFDAARTLEIILKLHPGTREVFVLNDPDLTGRAWADSIREQLTGRYPRLKISYAPAMTEEAAMAHVRKLPDDTVVLLGVFLRDAAGRYLAAPDFARRLSAASPVPIYALLELYLGYGVVGGELIDGYYQGKLAAELGKRILAGEDPDTLPVLRQGVTRAFFDYSQLQRFNIDENELPTGSILINKPASPYERDMGKIFAIAGFVVAESLLLLWLLATLTARRSAEAALQKSQERLTLTLDAINEGVWDWDIPSGTAFFSPRYYTMLGYPPYAFPQNFDSWLGLIHPDDREQAQQTVREYLDGRRFQIEIRLRTQSGDWRWIRSRGMVVEHDESGKPLRMVGTHADITERRQAGIELRASEERYRALIETMGEGVVSIDLNQQISYANPQFAIMIDIPREELLGRELVSLLTEESRTRFRAQFAERRKNASQRYELEWIKENGESLVSMVTPKPLYDREGAFIGSFAAINDITEMKEAQQELVHYRDHLEELVAERTAELARAKEHAEAANQAKSTFLANMSHELRTPLNVILGYTQLMQQDPATPEDQQEPLITINRSGEHLLALINDILEISRIESSCNPLEEAGCDIHGLCHDLDAMFRPRITAKGVLFHLEGLEQLPRYLVVDGHKLQQILVNLIDNAEKFTDRGSISVTLSLSTRLPESRVLIVEVRDTGPGIAADEQDRVFSSFDQTESGRHSQTGTGLGMTISREYARMMGGELGLSSQPGLGSTFRLAIPVKEAEQGPLSVPSPQKRVIGLAAGQQVPRILVVEDREENRTLLVHLLKNAEFSVREAEDGAEAVETFGRWHPDFIWMDIRMPKMDGLEATRLIRAMTAEGGDEVTIVALTAHAFKEERGPILAAGCNDLVCKPFRHQEIFGMLAHYLGVRYRYEPLGEGVQREYKEERVTPAQLASLPAELRRELHEAVLHLDTLRMRELVETVEAPSTQAALKAQVESMDYQPLLELLEKETSSVQEGDDER